MTGLRRLAAASALAAVATAAAGAGVAQVLAAPAASCSTPVVSSLSPQSAAGGTTIVLQGSGLTCGGTATPTVSVGGTSVAVGTGSSDSSLSVVIPPQGLYGTVQVSTADASGASHYSNSNLVFVTTPQIGSSSPSTVTEGQTITVTGSGFYLGGYSKPGAAATLCDGQAHPVTVDSDTSLHFAGPSTDCSGPIQLAFVAAADMSSGASMQVRVPSPGSVSVAVSGVALSTSEVAAGQSVTVTGSGLGTSGHATLAGAAISASWSDHAVTITVPAGASSGDVVVDRGDGTPGNVGHLTVDAVISGISPTSASPGDTVTIRGAGFGAQRGTVNLGSTAMAVQQWSPAQIQVTVPAGAQSGAVLVGPVGNGPPANPPSLSIVGSIGGVSPGHGGPGTYIDITGANFGAQTGSAQLGGHDVPVDLWNQGEIVITVPVGTAAGSTTITVTPVGGAPLTAAYVVDAVRGQGPTPPPPSHAPTPSAIAQALSGAQVAFIAPAAGGPIITTQHINFVKGHKPAGPVDLTLSAAKDTAKPGTDVPFTVTLLAFGKPVAGQQVDLQLVVEPGADASVTPATATTDDQGRVSGVIHLSRTPGDHIVLARSQTYSDEVRVTGRAASLAALSGNAAVVTGGAGADPHRTLILVALLACVVIFAAGFVLNLATHPTVTMGPAAVAVIADERRSPRDALVATARDVATVAGFGAAVATMVYGELAVRLRERWASASGD